MCPWCVPTASIELCRPNEFRGLTGEIMLAARADGSSYPPLSLCVPSRYSIGSRNIQTTSTKCQ